METLFVRFSTNPKIPVAECIFQKMESKWNWKHVDKARLQMRVGEREWDALWMCQIMWRDNRKHSVVCPALHVPADVFLGCGVSAAYSDAFQRFGSEERSDNSPFLMSICCGRLTNGRLWFKNQSQCTHISHRFNQLQIPYSLVHTLAHLN